jgi:hypothetical protein
MLWKLPDPATDSQTLCLGTARAFDPFFKALIALAVGFGDTGHSGVDHHGRGSI